MFAAASLQVVGRRHSRNGTVVPNITPKKQAVPATAPLGASTMAIQVFNTHKLKKHHSDV